MALATGGERVYEALRALQVEHVFGIVSVHNIPIYDAILRRGGITAIDMRHEQGALHAADGYARATGKLGVAITSTGPGAANAVPGLFESAFASSRVLMITGQVETAFYGKGKGALHEAEKQLEMLRTVARRVESPRTVADIASSLLALAKDVLTGRPQPGAIEIPIDLQYAQVEAVPLRFDVPTAIAPEPASLDAAARLIADFGKADNPKAELGKRVIWAGGGVISSGASAELLALAERLQAPVFTSANGRGALAENHALAMGPLTAQPQFQTVLAEADVIVAVGTRFQAGATAMYSLSLPGKLIHIDVDAAVVGRNYRADVAVIGDARLALRGLLDRLNAGPGDSGYLAKSQQVRDGVRASIREQIGSDFESIMDDIRRELPNDGNVVRDATVPAYLWGNRLLPILHPNTSLATTSAAIGPGLPLAIGAAVGTGKKTVVIQGDGGFMLSIGEMATAVQYQLPIIICLFNDRGYGVLRGIQRARFEGRNTGVNLATPNFVQVAGAMGMLGLAAGSKEEFSEAFRQAVAHVGPVLIEIDMTRLIPMQGLPGAPARRT